MLLKSISNFKWTNGVSPRCCRVHWAHKAWSKSRFVLHQHHRVKVLAVRTAGTNRRRRRSRKSSETGSAKIHRRRRDVWVVRLQIGRAPRSDVRQERAGLISKSERKFWRSIAGRKYVTVQTGFARKVVSVGVVRRQVAGIKILWMESEIFSELVGQDLQRLNRVVALVIEQVVVDVASLFVIEGVDQVEVRFERMLLLLLGRSQRFSIRPEWQEWRCLWCRCGWGSWSGFETQEIRGRPDLPIKIFARSQIPEEKTGLK